MSSITAQQTKLDLELVPKENRIDIGKCNGRIPRGLTLREPTFQVVLDAIALIPCYPAFLITTDVPEVYMHQFWNSVYKHDTFYRIKIDKKKRFKLTLEVFRDIFQIFPRVQGREFDPLPSEEDTRTFAALINRSLSGKTSGLDKLRLSRAQILWGMFHQKNVDYVELLWEDFIYQIENRVYKKQEKMYYPRFTKVIIYHFLIQEKSLSWRNKIRMHTSKDDYLINSLRFVSAKESSQIYGAILPECLTSPEMKESKAYKTYLGYATCAIPPKIARKFKKASPTKKDSDLVPVDEEPVTKGKRIKRSVKKSSTKPATGIVIREPPVETKSKGKEKEKVDVAHGKGIELLSEVALTEKAQLKEVRKKSLRDFHKTHPSGSGTGAEKPPSVEKITPTVTSEGTDDSNDEQESKDESSEQENESEEQESDDSEQEDESDDDNQEEEEVDQENESEDDEIESDEDKGMDDTTNQFDDDVDSRLEEPTQTGKEVVQGEGGDAEMIDAQQGNENLETTQEQVVEDARVIISTVMKKTEVPATSSSGLSDLASKFLNFSDIPHTDAEIVSPFDVPIQHEVPNTQTTTLLPIPFSVITIIPLSLQTFTPPPLVSTPIPPPTTVATNPPTTLPDFASVFRFNDRITVLEKEVAEIKKDPLHTQVTSLVDEHLNTRIKEQVKDQLPQILPREVSNFAPPVIEKLIKESHDEVTLAKVSSQPQSTYEAASTLTEFELKKILLDKMEKSESYLTAPEHRDCYDGLKKSYALDKDFFYSYEVYSLKHGRKDKDKDEDPSAGLDRGLKKRKTSKDAEPTIGQKNKDSMSGSSKGTKSQPKSSRKSIQSKEPVFEVAVSDLLQDQKGNLGDNKDEPMNETASRRNWFKKPTPP
ncbi:hypothetical protein Tco_1411345 [Tanacetum coccineum]